jgi:hypothetical protein
MSTWAERFALVALVTGCAGNAQKPEPVMDANYPLPVDAGASPAATVVDAGPPPPPPVVDAGAPPKTPPKVKVQYIGMHVGGGPFDDATKKPFETQLAPTHAALAECWAKHITRPKPFDMGVDLLIEASGGHPKVSNPRVRFEKGEDDGGFIACVTAVFEGVEFAQLARGKSGVSYSTRFTPTP